MSAINTKIMPAMAGPMVFLSRNALSSLSGGTVSMLLSIAVT